MVSMVVHALIYEVVVVVSAFVAVSIAVVFVGGRAAGADAGAVLDTGGVLVGDQRRVPTSYSTAFSFRTGVDYVERCAKIAKRMEQQKQGVVLVAWTCPMDRIGAAYR